MHDLRMKRQKAKAQQVETTAEPSAAFEVPDDVMQDFVGVSIRDVRNPNGSLFHDLGACYLRLSATDRPLFGRQLARLLHQWQGKIPAAEQPSAPSAEPAAGNGRRRRKVAAA
jgi:hypothetical protein